MNVSNLFDYCLDDIITKNKAIYFVGDIIGNTLFNVAIDNETNCIYTYSNEWLYLIKVYYPQMGFYDPFVINCNNIIKSKNGENY